MRRLLAIVLLVAVVAVVPETLSPTTRPASAKPPPNVILILTDDQLINTLQWMPHVVALADRGMKFERAFISNSLCCPSRSTILTGLSSGHTGVWTNGDGDPRWGGWSAFTHNGRNDNGTLFQGTGNNQGRTLALYLRRNGYKTGLFGKYLNHYEEPDGSAPPVPAGWSSWHSFVGANVDYYDYDTSDNGVLHHHGSRPRDYATNVFGRKARAFLGSPHIQDGTQPFFLYFAPPAPHSPLTPAPGNLNLRAPTSFQTPAYNERNVSDKPPYVRHTPLLTAHDHARMVERWDRAYATLVTVDKWVGRLEGALPTTVRDRTVFIFMSDNGQTWGDHRLQYKVYPYERSIRVPLVIAGPGIQHGTTAALAVNMDLTPTVLNLAGLSGVGGPFDGHSLVPVLHGTGPSATTSVLLEHLSLRGVPSYCGVRTTRWKYVQYRGGFQELYDLRRDPYELVNIVHRRPQTRARLHRRALRLCHPRPPDW